MKDPAFLFYPADFLIGCADLTNEEIGFYIKLLCLQHQKGHINQKTVRLFLGFDWFSLSEELRAKFKEDENGLIYNGRLDREIEKRAYHFDYHRENGKKGGRPKNQSNNQDDNQTNNQDETKNITKTKASRVENENINEDEILNENRDIGGMGEKEKEETPNVENHSTEDEETFFEVLDELSFENVWAMYGRKGNKKTSSQKWGKLKNHCKLAALKHIPDYVKATPDIQYRKNFETYINQEAWNDTIISKNDGTKGITITENGGAMGNAYSGNGANTFRTDAEKRRNERQMLTQMATAVLQQPETEKI